mmetsp:Transcript_13526/g.36137  ORF Transcript_13526/g.36137 Transcript_13526/m.36137 type:complete len:202 (-) Transcript_13526:241-846(-)
MLARRSLRNWRRRRQRTAPHGRPNGRRRRRRHRPQRRRASSPRRWTWSCGRHRKMQSPPPWTRSMPARTLSGRKWTGLAWPPPRYPQALRIRARRPFSGVRSSPLPRRTLQRTSRTLRPQRSHEPSRATLWWGGRKRRLFLATDQGMSWAHRSRTRWERWGPRRRVWRRPEAGLLRPKALLTRCRAYLSCICRGPATAPRT